jgi:translation initiation factor IF-3
MVLAPHRATKAAATAAHTAAHAARAGSAREREAIANEAPPADAGPAGTTGE